MKADGHILVIFGASGDLTKRKLIPALAELLKLGFLADGFTVLGIGRTKYSDESFRESIMEFHGGDAGIAAISDRLCYHAMDPTVGEAYVDLAGRLKDLCRERGMEANHLFYLATPPSMYGIIPRHLKSADLLEQGGEKWRRVIIEKPFGTDLESAKRLNRELLDCMDEQQIYRIDHYLGKETVQNLLVTRFSNGIFEPLWNRNYIHHIEITSAESMGVGTRGGYYDGSGALRDMLQNHLLQLVGMVSMEPPTVIASNAIRNEVLKVFQSFRPLTEQDVRSRVIRGQYTDSHVRGEGLAGYREEEGVPQEAETYVAMQLYVDNWRWGGVPFYIRTGKRLPTRVTEIVIHFKASPHSLFCEGETLTGNQLVIRIQPDEGILLKFGMKIQGAGFKVQNVNMDFHYSDLADSRIPEAYQRLLLDCMQGDSTLFARGDSVEAAWNFVAPVLEAWERDPDIALHGYPCGTWGPDMADGLIKGVEHTWRYPCKNLADDGLYCEL